MTLCQVFLRLPFWFKTRFTFLGSCFELLSSGEDLVFAGDFNMFFPGYTHDELVRREKARIDFQQQYGRAPLKEELDMLVAPSGFMGKVGDCVHQHEPIPGLQRGEEPTTHEEKPSKAVEVTKENATTSGWWNDDR